MNKSYRLVFNRAKGVIQVVAEFVKSSSKVAGSRTAAQPENVDEPVHGPFSKNIVALAVMGVMAGVSVNVHAAAWDGADGNTNGQGGVAGTSDFGGGAGGAGGSNQVDWLNLNPGQPTTIIQPIGGGGGGGAGSGDGSTGFGGNGGTGGNSGPAGGPGGTTAIPPAGADGIDVTVDAAGTDAYVGASGGGGGATGMIWSGPQSGPITGGDGGRGGSTIDHATQAGTTGTYGAAGGGGGGGAGVFTQTDANFTHNVYGGTGGNGGEANIYNASSSNYYTNTGGGGGGGGGAGVFVDANNNNVTLGITSNTVITGGAGGDGGYGAGTGGAGGAGGAGILGASGSGQYATTITNDHYIYGGDGGTGGDTGGGSILVGAQRSNQAGAGGAGGAGIRLFSGDIDITNNYYGKISGGAGGAGGNSVATDASGDGGFGGDGGHGIFLSSSSSNVEVNNYGSISGGNGSAGGSATAYWDNPLNPTVIVTGVNGNGGAGGDGIRFNGTSQVTIYNQQGATIQGGRGGAGGGVTANYYAYLNTGGGGGEGGAGIRLLDGRDFVHNDGRILGGAGGAGGAGGTGPAGFPSNYGGLGGAGGTGGAGVSVSQFAGANIYNGHYSTSALISGGNGGAGGVGQNPHQASASGGTGGAGVEFLSTGRNVLRNYLGATIQGGAGGAGGAPGASNLGGAGGNGGAGVVSNGPNTNRVTNYGLIQGGGAGVSAANAVAPAGTGGAGVNAIPTSYSGETIVRNYTDSSANPNQNARIFGGAGEAGANQSSGVGQIGGAGGAGITGAFLEITNGDGTNYDALIKGGTGGAGGAGGSGYAGGVGGAGGAAIALTAPRNREAASIVNSSYSLISGGTGGQGGTSATAGGDGGVGGAGILVSSGPTSTYSTVDNHGSIMGGTGGAGRSLSGSGGAGGAGGAGIEVTATSTLYQVLNRDAYSTISGGNGGAGAGGAAGGAGAAAILNNGTITDLTNAGSITGGLGTNGAANGAGIVNNGTITTLTNTGVIAGGTPSAVGIDNTNGSIGTLINAQGGDSQTAATTALSFKGVLRGGNGLALNYQTYVNSTTSYGQLSMSSISAGLNEGLLFGVYTNSALTANTYINVLTGIGSSMISNYSSIYNQWTTVGSYKWQLVGNSGCLSGCTSWDLSVVTAAASNILANQTYYTANLVGSAGGADNVNPVFDGGTLAVSAPSNVGATVMVTDAFTLSGNGGTIDQNSQNSVFSGVISDASGTLGGLTITNSGSGGRVEMTAVNTYTGSTTIDNGATLKLTGAGSIADSSGVINNGSFDVSSVTTQGGATIQSLSGSGLLALGAQTLTLSNAAGTFSGSITGSNAKLVIAAGTETLTGTNNNFTGGIEVHAGAALSINSASNLGANANTLALIGTPTTTATLNVLGTTTISNPISVSGDPTFNIASGTTTTINSPIADGSLPGDVVVAGAGTLNLTAANTYSGQTTVTNGATLALSGSGSIANSSGLTNSGTFNVASANGNVNLTSFTQNSTGNLVMGFSPTNNQKMLVSGAASLGGTLTLNPVAGSYTAGKYTLLSATGGVSGNFSTFNAGSLSSYTRLLYALGYDANDVYLTLYGNAGPSAQNTLQSVQMNTGGLANVINQQSAALQAGLQYDCVKYDENNLCISVGGRYTYAGSLPSGNAESGLVIVGYQPSATWRFGGFVDQSVSTTTPNNIKLGYSGPTWGLFNNWYMNKDRLGFNVQGSIAFANSKVTTTRTQLTDTEAGEGSTQMNGQGYQLQANYVQPVTDNLNAIPYFGLRYTRINNGAYTESASAQVTSPLSYNAMAQNTFAALAGVGASAHLAEKLKGTASVGIQQNLNYSMGNYAGTSQISGMETFSAQMPGSRNSMATASAGIYYDVRKNERIGMNVLWQQQPFINTNTATAIVTYTLGL